MNNARAPSFLLQSLASNVQGIYTNEKLTDNVLFSRRNFRLLITISIVINILVIYALHIVIAYVLYTYLFMN